MVSPLSDDRMSADWRAGYEKAKSEFYHKGFSDGAQYEQSRLATRPVVPEPRAQRQLIREIVAAHFTAKLTRIVSPDEFNETDIDAYEAVWQYAQESREKRKAVEEPKMAKCGICGQPFPAEAFCAPCVLD